MSGNDRQEPRGRAPARNRTQTEAAHSLADTGNDVSIFIAQRRSSRPANDHHPLG
jgi:hypothetical protein